ncbi:MAG: NAD(P)/FAD-dependent oxidoreductase [Verrucomicrobiota bacterium]|nr:NAD(P)/FAD-dependent oxidoreductase [Verrucomicrobiota bacterium]
MFDVAIVGSGPAGAACASFCAQAGLRVLLLERERFPREKVCGDCLNPACWPIFRRLGVADRVRSLPHGELNSVDFIAIDGRRITIPLQAGEDREIAVKRSLLDHAMLERARELGAEVREGMTVTGVPPPGAKSQAWRVATPKAEFTARVLVAADGRNSSVARFCGLLPRIEKERVAIQTHLRLPPDFGDRVVLQFRPEGYSGQAPVGEGELNLCLVSTAPRLREIRSWAEETFHLDAAHSWRTITPLTRAPISLTTPGLFLIGDAARVVEPLTGEGIYYALSSGEFAAEAAKRIIAGEDPAFVRAEYERGHEYLYRGRLWVNRLARQAVLHPKIASAALRLSPPTLLDFLTQQIVRS